MLAGDRVLAPAWSAALRRTMQASTSSPRTGSGVARDRARGHRRMLVQDALDLDRRDVLAAAPDHVLAPVDEVEVAVGAAPHDVAGVEPAAGPGLLGRRIVLQVAEEEVARGSAPAARTSSSPGTSTRDVGALLVDDARLDERLGAAEAGRADVARLAVGHDAAPPAPVSVIAQASSSGRPKRASNAAWCARVDAGAEAEAQLVHRGRPSLGGAASSIAGITPR